MFFFFSSRRRHTRYWRDWSSDVCSSDLLGGNLMPGRAEDVSAQEPARVELCLDLRHGGGGAPHAQRPEGMRALLRLYTQARRRTTSVAVGILGPTNRWVASRRRKIICCIEPAAVREWFTGWWQ